jgi:hypothetical protein
MDFGADKRYWYGLGSGGPIVVNGTPCSASCAAGMPMLTEGKTTGFCVKRVLPMGETDRLPWSTWQMAALIAGHERAARLRPQGPAERHQRQETRHQRRALQRDVAQRQAGADPQDRRLGQRPCAGGGEYPQWGTAVPGMGRTLYAGVNLKF